MRLDGSTVIGVVGAVAMGAGIAQVAASRGHRVVLADASAANGLAAQLELEAQLMQEAGRTADYEEGVRAFLEKRTPRYQGR